MAKLAPDLPAQRTAVGKVGKVIAHQHELDPDPEVAPPAPRPGPVQAREGGNDAPHLAAAPDGTEAVIGYRVEGDADAVEPSVDERCRPLIGQRHAVRLEPHPGIFGKE